MRVLGPKMDETIDPNPLGPLCPQKGTNRDSTMGP